MAESKRSSLRTIPAWILANPGYKLLSLLVSVLLWLYVQGDQVVEAKVRAAVEWKLPNGLVPTEPLPLSVSIAVQGSRSAVRKAEEADVKVTADLSDAAIGEHTFDFAATGVQGLVSTVKVRDFSPSSVRFVVDAETSRKVKVNPVLVGDPASGYRVASQGVDPNVVEIRGPRLVIADLIEVATKPIDVSGLTGNVNLPVELELPWGVSAAGGGWLRAKIDVEPVVERLSLGGVPVSVWDMPDWVSAVPEVEVQLEGPSGALATLDRKDVAVLAYLPDNPARSAYEAQFGPKEGLRLEVMTHNEQVHAVAVKPSVVQVKRR